jgi:hypothetical protein
MLNFSRESYPNIFLREEKEDILLMLKLLKNNDSWLTSEIIGSLNDALFDENFQVRRHALGILN